MTDYLEYIKPLLQDCKPGTQFHLPVNGDSMFPVIHSGDTVLITISPAGVIPLGSIVFALNGSDFIVHRLIHLVDSTAILKGDHLPRFDPPIAQKQILGIIERVYHRNTKTVVQLSGGFYLRITNQTNRLCGRIYQSSYTLLSRTKNKLGIKQQGLPAMVIRLLQKAACLFARASALLYLPLESRRGYHEVENPIHPQA